MGPGPQCRRIVLRIRGRTGRRVRPPGRRHRDRRVHRLPRLTQRGGRAEADRRHRRHHPGGPHQRQPGQPRTDGAVRRRRGPPARRPERPRRSPQGSAAAPRLVRAANSATGRPGDGPGRRHLRRSAGGLRCPGARPATSPPRGPTSSTTSSRSCWPSWSTIWGPTSTPGRARVSDRWRRWSPTSHAHPDVELPYFGDELLTQALGTGGRRGDAYVAARARNLAWAVSECLDPALEGADVLVAAAYGPAWKSDLVVGGHAGAVSSWVTTPAAIAGWPIMTVPAGLVHGLPVGLALVARPGAGVGAAGGRSPGRVRGRRNHPAPPTLVGATRSGLRGGRLSPRPPPSGWPASAPCRPGCVPHGPTPR